VSKPRVSAVAHIEPIGTRVLCEPHPHVTPEVTVDVSFDLHDHGAALAALDRAVADVRAQIEETE